MTEDEFRLIDEVTDEVLAIPQIGCGQCEAVCPQHLPIIELLQEAAGILDT